MIAHGVGVNALQAGMGSRVIDTRPEDEARAALSTIEPTSRETPDSLPRTPTALRRTAPGSPDLAPAPGLADLDRLTTSAATAGVRATLRHARGAPVPLPPDVDLAAYRVVQVSLTNVVRYAAARARAVTIAYGEGELRVLIEDGPAAGGRGEERAHGHRPGVRGAGFGVAGMRERVALLDRRCAAGPPPASGFRIGTWLPVPANEPVGAGPAPTEAAAHGTAGARLPVPTDGFRVDTSLPRPTNEAAGPAEAEAAAGWGAVDTSLPPPTDGFRVGTWLPVPANEPVGAGPAPTEAAAHGTAGARLPVPADGFRVDTSLPVPTDQAVEAGPAPAEATAHGTAGAQLPLPTNDTVGAGPAPAEAAAQAASDGSASGTGRGFAEAEPQGPAS